MRFQQLKRDPNSVMRKKLVKSKKAWVVVSSLSIAGGLLMMTAPSYVAKAEVTTAAPTTQTETKPSSMGTTSQDSSKVTVPATSAPAPTITADGGGSKTAEVPTTTPAVESGTEVKSTEDASDLTKESTPETTPKETSEPAPTVEKPTVKDATAETSGAETETAALSVVVPATGVEQETTVPDGSTDEKTVVTPANPENPVTGDSDTKVKTALDPSIIAESKMMNLTTTDTDLTLTDAKLADTLGAEAVVTPVTPVAEVTTVKTNTGNGWTYDAPSTTLTISGKLDESDGTDKERWGGNTSEITTIDIKSPIIAPKNSSYLFANMTKLTDIKNLENLQFVDSEKNAVTTTTKGMFRNDSSITSIDLSKNTLYNITDISHMFENDTSLISTAYSTENSMNIAQLKDSSYAYANDTSLIDPGVALWQEHQLLNMTGMFKNDNHIENLDLKSWYQYSKGIQTGNSSKGEGMFDGTDLKSITINGSMYFSPETALTSTHGTLWINTFTDPEHGITTPATDKNFSGVPTFTNGIATGGIGSQFNEKGALGTKYTFVAQQAPEGSTVTNIISVPTNHEGIYVTVTAQGKVGDEVTISDSDIPSSITIDGVTYNKETSDLSTPIKAIIANMTSTKAESSVNYLGAAVAKGSIIIPITKNGVDTGETITLDVASGNVGGSTTINLTSHLPAGYELKNPSENMVNISYNDTTATSPYTFSPTMVELVGIPQPVSKKAGYTAVTPDGNHDIIIGLPSGSVGDTNLPVTITTTDGNPIKGYDAPKLTVNYTANGPVIYQNGTPVDTKTNDINYTPSKVNAGTKSGYTAVTADGDHDIIIGLPGGSVGDTNLPVTITTADGKTINGFDAPKLTVNYTANGPVIYQNGVPVDTSTNKINYTPSKVNADTKSGYTAVTADGDHDIIIGLPSGSVGDTDLPVTITTADGKTIKGFDAPKLTVNYTANGPVIYQNGVPVDTSTNKINYTPSKVNAGTKSGYTAVTADGDHDIIIGLPSGSVGDTDLPVTITTADGKTIKGFDAPKLTVNYTANGPVIYQNGVPVDTSTNKINYTPSKVNADTKSGYTAVTADGDHDIIIGLPSGSVGDTDLPVTITTADGKTIKGFDAPKLTVDYTADGPVIYQNGVPVDTSTNRINYTPSKVSADSKSGYTAVTADGDHDIIIGLPGGSVGDTNLPVTITTADGKTINGFDAPKLTVDYTANGPVIYQNGVPVDTTTNKINYTPSKVNADTKSGYIAVTDNGDHDIIIGLPSGSVGDTDLPVTITTADGNPINGFDAPKLTVDYTAVGPVIYQNGIPVNTTTNKINYTPSKVNAGTKSGYTAVTADGNHDITIDLPGGTVGDKNLPVTITTADGRTINGFDAPALTVDYTADGPVIYQNGVPVDTTTNKINYTPSKVNADTKSGYTAVTADGDHDIIIGLPSGSVGDTDLPVTITTTDGNPINGFDAPKLTVNYTANGPVIYQNGVPVNTTTNKINYTPSKVNADTKSGYTAVTTDGDHDITIGLPSGSVGDENLPVTITTADGNPINGFDAPKLTVSYTANGPVIYQNGVPVDTSNNKINYTPSKVNADTKSGYTAVTADGDHDIIIGLPSGSVGDTDLPVTITTADGNPINGFDAPKLTVNYTANGPVIYQDGVPVDTSNNKINYTPSHVKPITLNDKKVTAGNKSYLVTIQIPESTVGLVGTGTVTVTPVNGDIEGYPATNIDVHYTPNGPVLYQNGKEITDKNPIKFTGKHNDGVNITVKNPDGKTTSNIAVEPGNYGDTPRTYPAKQIAGYKPLSITVTYGADGTPRITYTDNPAKEVSPTDELSYTRIPSSSGSSTVKPVDPTEGVIEQKVQTISTYSDKPDVELYQIGSDNKMSQISNRDLATASNWYSDATVTIDGVSYYRVATNEWAKMSQAYPYQALNLHIRTYNDSEKDLYKAENIVISNETLAPSSSWITDRETYVINNTKYYRVATNEFVNADDVYVYSPVSMVVTTHANQYTTVYDAKGAAVTDRSLNSDSSWKVDSIAYINGDKYYRVATDEFVKASDVDVNTLR